MLSPELQRIIDKVTSYATTPIIGSKGQTAAQGRALLGVGGILEGLQTNAASVAGAASRTAAAESGATERAKINEEGQNIRAAAAQKAAEDRAKMAESGLNTRAGVTAGLEEKKLGILEKAATDAQKQYPFGMSPTPTKSPTTKNWWEQDAWNDYLDYSSGATGGGESSSEGGNGSIE